MTQTEDWVSQRHTVMLNKYLKEHQCSSWTLFALAYHNHHHILHTYECERDYARFQLCGEMPDYLIAYLLIPQNGGGRVY